MKKFSFIILLASSGVYVRAGVPEANLTKTEPPFRLTNIACGTNSYTEQVFSVYWMSAGGQGSKLGEFPWIVKLHRDANNSPFCAGSILDTHHILTAAHCVKNCSSLTTVGADNVTVIVGAHERVQTDGSGQVHEVEKVLVHEGFCSGRRGDNDIAILRVAKPMVFDLTWYGAESVNAICLPKRYPTNYSHGDKMVLAGFGMSAINPASYERVLQRLEQPYVDGPRCRRMYSDTNSNYEPRLEVCAGGVEGSGGCRGDSGGPLMRDVGGGVMELVGVMSRGESCFLKDRPGIFSRADAYLDWIAASVSLASSR